MGGPPAKSATVQLSGVEFIGMLAETALMGVPAVGGRGVAPNSADGASSGTVTRVELILLVEAVRGRRGDGVKGWMAGTTRWFRGPTRWVSDRVMLSNSRGVVGDATEEEVRGPSNGGLGGGRVFKMSEVQSYTTEAWVVRLSWVLEESLMSTTLYFLHRTVDRR